MYHRIKNITKDRYKIFKGSEIYQSLKHVPLLKEAKLSVGKAWNKRFPYSYQLHGDPILVKVFEQIGKAMRATSIIETGTFLGSSTSLFAQLFPDIPIYTGEINEVHYRKAQKRLQKFPNVHIFHRNSPEFLKEIIAQKLPGERPLFFLDAHWLDQWPLGEEIAIIAKELKSAVIFIDDFKVNDPRFAFDRYGDKECSLTMVNPYIHKKKAYHLFFPHYGSEVFHKEIDHPELVGYPIIFQEMPGLFQELKKDNFVQKYFVDASSLIKPSRN